MTLRQAWSHWNCDEQIGAVSKKTDTKWNISTICGTAPAKSGTGTMNSTMKVTKGMLFQDVIQCNPLNVSHGSRSSHKLSFRMIVLFLYI